jgi:hypothetical protein
MCTVEFTGRELRASVVDGAEVGGLIARQREANARLEREIAAARAALQGEICRTSGPIAPLAPPAEGAAPGQQGAAPAPPEGPTPLRIGEGTEPATEGSEKAPEEPSPATPAPQTR